MAPKIFLTGITGYIGGDTFVHINAAHPEYEWSALVRTEKKAEQVRKLYPNVNIVLGELDDYDVIKNEAAKADVVIHTADASDHAGAAKAIAQGIAEGHTKERPGFWLHTSGTGILCWEDSKYDRLGEWSDKEYNDWTGVEELTNLPDEAFHRDIDKLVLEAGTGDKAGVIKTAIVCPPTIYGKGRGPSSTRGRQVYELAKLILTAKYTPIIGEGKARWNYIHVEDLAEAFLLLTEAAVNKNLNSELWGAKGYFLTEDGEHIWGDLSKAIAKKAEELGYISNPKEQALSKDAALDQAGFEAVSWGLNSRGKAERANKLLGWKATHPSIEDDIPNILQEEHARISKV